MNTPNTTTAVPAAAAPPTPLVAPAAEEEDPPAQPVADPEPVPSGTEPEAVTEAIETAAPDGPLTAGE